MPLERTHREELIAIVALLVALFVGLALLPIGVTGPAGRLLGQMLKTGLGIGAMLLPAFGIAVGVSGLGWVPNIGLRRLATLFGGLILLVPYGIAVMSGVTTVDAFPADYGLWSTTQKLVGFVPALIAVGVTAVVGTAGAIILGILGLSGATLVSFGWHPFRSIRRGLGEGGGEKGETGFERKTEPWEPEQVVEAPSSPPPSPPPHLPRRRGRKKAAARDVEALDELPPLDLLEAPAREAIDAGEGELNRLADVLIDTLMTFRVVGHVVGRTTGPVVTQYEVAPAPGVKVGRFTALADDLALALKAQSIRIVAPIPGKAAVGIEIPNPQPRIVRVRELLEAPEWDRSRSVLPITLGKDLEGRPVIADLAKMPHLLIAGATGSGKSVCINTIITSLCYRYTPRELRMLMIDPKMVELASYNALPHLRHPVVTNNRQAAQTLKWAVHEMERRYELFSANGARNISDFNRRVDEGRELVQGVSGERGAGADGSPASSAVAAETRGTPKGVRPPPLTAHRLPLTYDEGRLPYIIVIVDELADLMMTVQGEVERPLAMLAQKARATGVHLILATQRPSVNVITGLIKANFPSRIAFRVASKVDSRTILDQNGAEALLGNGDMLFLPPGKSEPIRVQGAFISTEESERVTEWYESQRRRRDEALRAEGLLPPEQREADILAVVEALEAAEASVEGSGGGQGGGDRDPLFREAAEVCLQHQQGSTSLLQRKLRIGYGRAARIVDQLYEAGILGPPDGSKPREVLIGSEQLDEYV